MLTNLRLSPLARLLLTVEGDGGAGAGGSGGGGTGGTTIEWTPEQQAEIDRIMGRTRSEAERIATRNATTKAASDLAEQLGCTPEEAKAKLEQLAAAEEAKKDEVQKANDRAAAAEAQRDAEKAARESADAKVAHTAAEAKMSTALLLAGLQAADPKADDKARAQVLADALRLVDIDAADDEAAVLAKVSALKERMPALFAPAAAPPPPPAGAFAPPAPKPPVGGNSVTESQSQYEQGARLAAMQPHLRSA